MEYRIRDDMPTGAVIHQQLVGGEVIVHLNSEHQEWWEPALSRLGLDWRNACPVRQRSIERSAS